MPFAMAVSPDQPGHVYVAYNDFNGTQYNVFLVQSTDGGQTWSRPVPVNDDIASGRVADHFQPEVASGAGGAVGVAFVDPPADFPPDARHIKQDPAPSDFCTNRPV